MKYRLLIAAICVCALFASIVGYIALTNQKIDAASVVGSYEAKEAQSISRLLLRSNGTYLHEYIANGKTVSNTGTWSLEDTGDQRQVALSNANFSPGEIENKCNARGGYCLLEVCSLLGKTSLVYDIDLGLAFEKLSSHPIP